MCSNQENSKIEKCEMPLVSVPVVTYNSAKTVIETLESIKAQTYPNIELIISDDCSTDNTVALCREWVEMNKERFVRTEIITVEKNTGVSGNSNRSKQACRAEWIKGIAGDDLLMPLCIQTYIEYIQKYQDVVFVFSRVQPFYEKDNQIYKINNLINYDFFNWSIEEQYHHMLFVRNEIPTPTTFYNKKNADSLGLVNDERIPMMEDWPKWVNLLKKGVRFHFIDEPLVMYRVSEQSISNSTSPSKAYRQSLALFYLYYQHEEFWKKDKLLAIKKYINAKKQLNDNLFWKIANRGIKAIYKRIRHEQE